MHADRSLIAIVGPGRLGRSLHTLLRRTGWPTRLVDRAGLLAGEADGREIVMLTVPDDQIAEVSSRITPGPVVLHCSGATGLDVLSGHRARASLHPLMTFPGPEVSLPDLAGVPAAIDGDAEGLRVARDLAEALGLEAFRVSGDRRLYHAAAVLAGNGATVLLAEACRALVAAGVAPERAAGLLQPLVSRSIANAVPDPTAALTGPVVRGDVAVLRAHAEALRKADLADVAELHLRLAQAATDLLRHDLLRGASRPSSTDETSGDETG